MSTVYLNGQFLPRADAKLSVDERGFLFGDGIYEVTRVIDGRLFESARHMRRLAHGLRELRLTPSESLGEIEAISLRLLEENDMTSGEGMVYLQITRGAAPRTHHFPPAGTPCTVFSRRSASLCRTTSGPPGSAWSPIPTFAGRAATSRR